MKLRMLVLGIAAFLLLSASGFAGDWDMNMDVPYDLGGREIRYEHGGARPEDDSEANIRAQQIAGQFNATLEWVTGWIGNIETWTAGIVAGDPLAHIMRPNSRNFYGGIAHGLFAPLDDVLEEIDYWENTVDRFRAENFMFQGVTYGIPFRYFVRGTILMWNKDLFEREGLPNLYDIYHAGDWTFDTLMDIVNQASRDTTGDGEIDRPGLALRQEQLFIEANNGQYYKFDEDGRVVVAFADDEFVTASEFLMDLYLHEGTIRIDRYDMLDMFADGDIAMITGQMCYKPRLMGNAIDWDGQERRLNLMEDDYGLLPLPIGPHGTDYVNHEGLLSVTFPVIEEDLAAVVELASWLTRSSRKYYDVDTQEAELFDGIADYLRDEESFEIFDHLWHTAVIRQDPGPRLPGRPEYLYLYTARGDYPSISAAIDAVQPEAQAFLDEFFRQ